MIVFQPIGYSDYKKHANLKFENIPIELVEKGDFKLYLRDEEAHTVASLESVKNSDWDYVAYVMQYCLEEEYIEYLKKLNKINSCDWMCVKTLSVPKTDGPKINSAIIHGACGIGFYYNKANKDIKMPMDIEEVRRMRILHYYSMWDPEGLIEMCAPRDEYYYEIHQIWDKISVNTSTEELAKIIEEVTEEVFGKNYTRKGTNILEIAKNIDFNVI